ncbi:glutamate racemase [Alkalithermobacter paradoxus]|uniref:Glutamate racemase n=1 Tax=Alkalithermobacter paradoxus TaxID=29349 RepID=A0A1V4I4A5_9FIRM|nr:glutamate racemase 1 [[Clostridium] thermoalcaliphilum]
MENKPIGVFDSGIGGLTVLKEIMEVLPNEDIVYFGDTARVPYGPRSKETVTKYTFQCINFLLTKNIKAIVIACNTATARSLKLAQEKYDVPIIGVVEAGAKTAVNVTKNKRVGVIGTEGTINSKAYETEIGKIDSNINTIGKPCPLFVPIVEEGWADTDISYMAASRYLNDLKDKNIDALVLGCTHYPLLMNTISKVMGSSVTLVNPARETAKDLKNVLMKENLLRDQNDNPKYEYYVSDGPDKFKQIGENFLKKEIDNINLVEIHKY